jgi:hypothetical protein
MAMTDRLAFEAQFKGESDKKTFAVGWPKCYCRESRGQDGRTQWKPVLESPEK